VQRSAFFFDYANPDFRPLCVQTHVTHYLMGSYDVSHPKYVKITLANLQTIDFQASIDNQKALTLFKNSISRPQNCLHCMHIGKY
jgi:hypothetical protein